MLYQSNVAVDHHNELIRTGCQTHLPANVNQSNVAVDQGGPGDVEMNLMPMSVNLPHASQSNITPPFPDEPPRRYNETSATPNDGVDVLPTYDEPMAMNKQDK